MSQNWEANLNNEISEIREQLLSIIKQMRSDLLDDCAKKNNTLWLLECELQGGGKAKPTTLKIIEAVRIVMSDGKSRTAFQIMSLVQSMDIVPTKKPLKSVVASTIYRLRKDGELIRTGRIYCLATKVQGQNSL